MISEHLNEADGRVVRLRPRTAASHRSHLGKAAIAHSGPDYSPVPDLLKYERPESIDDYRHRMATQPTSHQAQEHVEDARLITAGNATS